jgi:hypothetical protein
MQVLKEGLNSEEKFFESAVRTERFVKKYQKPMIASVVVLVLALGGSAGYKSYQEMKTQRANKALTALLSNPADKGAMKELSDNSKPLFELYELSKALHEKDMKSLQVLKTASSSEVADIATYESAILSNDTKGLETYTKKQGGVYQEFAILEEAVSSIQAGNTQSAHTLITSIKEDSALYSLAQMLSHYGVK